MKRVSLHILFWLAFLLEDSLLQFFWVAPLLTWIPESRQMWMALAAGFVVSVPKMIFSYFLMYFAIGRILTEKKNRILDYVWIFLVLCICIIIYRVSSYYYTYPFIYGANLKERPIFEIRMVLMSLLDIGFVAGAATAIKLTRIQLKGKEREKNLLKEKLETELKFLRNQTNPHFLFNTLNNIYGLARKKSDDTAEIVLKLSKLLRFMLYESANTFISIADELKMLEDYLELEKIRYNDRLTITFKKNIDDPSQKITPLLLLPLIENAFKHGISETISDSYIHMNLALVEGQLRFEIENTKESTDYGVKKGSHNIGLVNLKRQLELIYTKYELEVMDHPDHFKVCLHINLDSHANV